MHCNTDPDPLRGLDRRISHLFFSLKSNQDFFQFFLYLCYQVEKDAQEMADREGVRIFQADIIYHLFDRWAPYTILIVNEYCENGRLLKPMYKSSRLFREMLVKKCSCLDFV
jgi:hypothetical protein